MLAEMSSGLLPGFAVALLMFLVGLSAFGGGALLWVGANYVAKIPNSTYWKCVGAYVLFCLVGSLLPIAGLFLGWLVIKGILNTTYGKAVLAWLPTLGNAVLAVPLLVAILLPALATAREYARRASCKTNVSMIGRGIAIYTGSNMDQFPPDLSFLVRDGQSPSIFVCPSTNPKSRSFDYFYVPSTASADSATIILCDYHSNHKDGYRTLLYQDLHVGDVRSEAEFQQMLALPINAKFAQALRKAEGTLGPESP